MANPMIRIHNVETDEIIDREMTAEELIQYEIDLAASEQQQAEKIAKEQTKQTILNRLGITAEEAQILLS